MRLHRVACIQMASDDAICSDMAGAVSGFYRARGFFRAATMSPDASRGETRMTNHYIKVMRQRDDGTREQIDYVIATADPIEPGEIGMTMVFVDEGGIHFVNNDGVDRIIDSLVGADVAYCDKTIVFDVRESIKMSRRAV